MQTPTLQELLEAGVHFGHQVRRGHPRMKQYIYGAREGVHVIDLTKSASLLQAACDYAFELGKSGGVLLFVGTKKQAGPIVQDITKRIEAPYFTSRWIGGFLTNFEEISKNIKKLKELKEQREKGELSKYTKKEQLLISRKIDKLEKDLGGVAGMTQIPQAIYIIDMVREDTAVREANRAGLKIIAIADSNSNPSLVDYPIPGNDDAIKSIKVLTEAVASSYEEGKKQFGKDVAKKAEEDLKAKQKADEEAALPKEVAEEVAAAEEEVEKETLEDSERKKD